MESKDMPKCDVCGKPATRLARDVLRYDNYSTGWAEFSPIGNLKAGCDDHPVESVEHETALPFAQNP